MISLFEAQKLILENTKVLASTDIALAQAANHFAAKDIISPIEISPFRNSAMDGFAVSSKQITSIPCTLDIADTVFAGDQLPAESDSKKAMKIMTGAPVPDQYDTVIRFEDTSYDHKQVTINIAVETGKNIRMPGEDIAIGETVIKKNYLVRPLELGVLASIGLEQVSVIKKPRVLIISTGNELVQAGQPLGFGQIYDSNSFTIEGMISNFCSSVEKHAAVSDDITRLTEELSTDHDIIISSGGVSMGEKDYLPKVAEECGWKTLFHKVAIKPGKPVFVATKGKQILFGLPGNPLSTAVTCAVFVMPALEKIIGSTDFLPKLNDATLDETSPMKSGRTVVWPGTIKQKDGQLIASIANKRSSAALSAILKSDGLIFLLRDQIDSTPVVKVLKWQEIIQL